MRLTILGCWAPYQRSGGACSGYLLQAGDTYLLIDCGNGSFSNLQKHLDFRQLTGAVISHLHPDHYLDLFSLRHALASAKRAGSRADNLPVWLPNSPALAREQLAPTQEAFQFQDIENLTATPEGYLTAFLGDCKLQFLLTDHPLPCYALAVEYQQQRLVYTADTGWHEPLLAFAQGADLLLCEASFQDAELAQAPGLHLTARQAGELARQTGAKKLVLTHFWPEHNLATTKREAQEGYGSSVILAEEGLVISL